MPNGKIDYLIEAVHYLPDGNIDFVRLYARRGSSYSDRVLFTRDRLLEALKSRKAVFTGKRLPGLATTFEVFSQVNQSETGDKTVIYNQEEPPAHDKLENVPIL